ncbi:MAG: steroid delta-isomerase, partial [Alphaproteobacteria bacterium]|nr:steroid delta-isomerase [Alphaproteobacteria bacterium]
MARSPKMVVRDWVEAFNRADLEAITALYAQDAVNHQVAYQPVEGRAAIRDLFATEFARADMHCDI